jgi:hypothetical protein
MVRRWLVPGVCTRRGSAHRRRGQPCQDATLQLTLTLPGGLPLTLLAVADGHGGPAYYHSDVGSALACEAAAEVVANALTRLPAGTAPPTGADLLALRRWLAEDLPHALQQHWLAAVRQHWLAGPGGGEGGVPFSPLPYGSTLGLLLLTPRWWALAGLGDWDLVRVDPAGAAELLSQELGALGAGEATASLCQEGAALGGWFRSWVWPLDDQVLPFSLVLSTDGIRKSCASDADFLALAAWLAAGPDPTAAVCDSVASDSAQPDSAHLDAEPTDAAHPVAVHQDLPRSDIGGSDTGERVAGVEALLAEALDRISAEGCGDDVSVAIGRWQAGEPPPPPSNPSVAAAVPAPLPRPPLRALPLLLSGGLALLIGVALGQRLPLASAPHDPLLVQRPGLPQAGREPLRREVGRLCGDPALLVPSLQTRHSQVQGLRHGTLQPETLLIDGARDPLGALIAASFLEHHPEAGRQKDMPSLVLCPALRSALGSLWLPAGPPAIQPAMGRTSRRPSP